jgi:hypothetical protein
MAAEILLLQKFRARWFAERRSTELHDLCGASRRRHTD